MKTTLHQPFLCLALLLSLAGWVAGAAGSDYSYGGTAGKNGNCLDCHGNAGKVEGNLFIDPVKYRHTNHARIGCLACHDAVTGEHPVARGEAGKTDCRECHGDTGAEYARSSHAKNASCNGCHDPHRVNAPSEISGRDVNRMCAGCHDTYGMTVRHAEWLPQAGLHMEMLPCITCHTGSRNYVINLYIIKRQNDERFGRFDLAGYDDLHKLAGGKDILSLIDTNGDNYVSLVELRDFNRNPAYNGLHLQGMMTPEQVTHSFQILDNRRDCTFCHASGPGAMQKSSIAIPGEDGAFRRVVVETGAVLDVLYGTPDFYMTGKTRSKGLDKIGLVIVAGGLVMPVGHGFLRFLSRNLRNRKENRHE